LLFLVACVGAPEGAATYPNEVNRAVKFETCSLLSSGSDTNAECANIDVPLDWSRPEGQRANFFVKRVKGRAPGPHKQLWLLQGGPGGAGNGFERAVALFQQIGEDVDLYIPDHRGTGRSTLLDCPSTIGATARCATELEAQWGREALATFSTTTAARDLGYAIEKTRAPKQETHIYGVSYGTYLAQRYLQIFPTQPTSVVLDSVCQAGLCSLLRHAYWSDRAAQRFWADCKNDALCSGRLGGDPIARVKEAIAIADAGTCAGLARLPRGILGNVLHSISNNIALRSAAPALVHRILRCDATDVPALEHFTAAVTTPPPPPPAPARPMNSDPLKYNIAFSEMVEVPVMTRKELETLMGRESVFLPYTAAMHDAFDAWPKYAPDELVGKYPETSVPLLILNGTHDAATVIEFSDEVASHYTKPNQSYVVLPRGTHGALFASKTIDGTSCGFEIMKQFVNAPTSKLDTSCTERVLPHTFEANPQVAQMLFGRTDLWDARPDVVGPRMNTDEELKASLEEAREQIVVVPKW